MEFKDKSHRLARRVLALLNKKRRQEDLVIHIVRLIQAELGLECIGIRLNDGKDYPYFFTRGFSDEFIVKENYLCAKDEAGQIILDKLGNPLLECMCGNVIRRKTNSSLSFFTPFGSFWTNSTTKLLASTTETERESHTRNQCNKFGYESVALIPIRSENVTLGLLQLNDSRDNRFTVEMIEFLEGLGGSIGLLLLLKSKNEELEEEKNVIRQKIESTAEELEAVSHALQMGKEARKSSKNGDASVEERLDSILDELQTLNRHFKSPQQ